MRDLFLFLQIVTATLLRSITGFFDAEAWWLDEWEAKIAASISTP